MKYLLMLLSLLISLSIYGQSIEKIKYSEYKHLSTEWDTLLEKNLIYEIKALNYFLDSILYQYEVFDSIDIFLEKNIMYHTPYAIPCYFYEADSICNRFKQVSEKRSNYYKNKLSLKSTELLFASIKPIIKIKRCKPKSKKIKKYVNYGDIVDSDKHPAKSRLLGLEVAETYQGKYYVSMILSRPYIHRKEVPVYEILITMDKNLNIIEWAYYNDDDFIIYWYDAKGNFIKESKPVGKRY